MLGLAPIGSKRGWAFALFGGCLVANLAACQAKISDRSIRSISIAEVRRVLEQREAGNERLALLVDPRAADEFAAGRLPGSLNIGLGQVDPDAGKPRVLEGYRYLIVYGEDPIDPPAVGMTKRLMQTGFRGVRLYRGGLSEWRAYGFPIESDQPAARDTSADGGDDAASGGEDAPGAPRP